MRNKSGFTLLEVLIVITIAGVMMGFGFNYIMGWLPNYRVRQATRDVYSNLQFAKMQAIKQHINCAVSFTKTGGVIDGYEIYLDKDSNRQRDPDDANLWLDDTLLRTVLLTEYKGDVLFETNQTGSNPPTSGDGVTFSDNDNGEPTITFLSNGLLLRGGTAGFGGTVYLINDTGKKTRYVRVNQVGRIEISQQ